MTDKKKARQEFSCCAFWDARAKFRVFHLVARLGLGYPVAVNFYQRFVYYHRGVAGVRRSAYRRQDVGAVGCHRGGAVQNHW